LFEEEKKENKTSRFFLIDRGAPPSSADYNSRVNFSSQPTDVVPSSPGSQVFR
jgi:hypothetical protein